MYKLIASDLDGTLLNDNKEISISDIESIHKIIDMGYFFCFSTGRPYRTCESFIKALDRDIPLILCNGAIIRTALSNKIIYENPLGYDLFIKICKKYNKVATPIIWADYELYSTRIDEFTDFYTNKLDYDPIVIEPTSLKDKNITKMILLGEHDVLLKIQKEASKLFNDVHFFFSNKCLLEVAKVDVSKDKGLKILAGSLGIGIDECIAVGDEENDLSMLKVAGLPIAVKNSKDSLKEVASYVTTSTNNESPITEIIDKFIFNK